MKKARSRIGLILLAYVAFIALGLPDGLLGVAWPSIRARFSLPLDSLGGLLVAVTAGYLTSSFFSGRLMARLGVGGLLAASCATTGVGLVGYTLAPTWWMMIGLGGVAGLGAGAIDAGLNTTIASNWGAGFMQWLHASYGIGVTLGPVIMTTAITGFHNWKLGYVLVGVTQLTLAACFALTVSQWQQRDDRGEAEKSRRLIDYQTPLRETLRQRRVWLSTLLFFCYAGTEVTLGNWGYTLLTESRHIPPGVAGLWAGSYWATFTIGRILAGLYTKRVGAHTLVRVSVLAALGGAVLLWWNPSGAISLLGMAVIGFAIAPIFPGLVSGTSERVSPRYAANTIGMQIGAASFGSAVLSGLAGVIAQRTSLEIIPPYLILLLAVLFGLYSVASTAATDPSPGPPGDFAPR